MGEMIMVKKNYKPLYEQVKDYILDKINNREWLPGQRIPTELELAEIFDVSRITTKRAMEDLAREGIIERIQGQGSFVSMNPQPANNGFNQIVSMIIPYDNTRPELIDYISGATDVLNQNNYYLAVHCTKGENVKMEREFLLELPKDGVSGIIYYPLNINSEIDILEPMCVDNYPMVTIDKYLESLSFSSVVSKNYEGAYTVITKLIEAGHKKIAFITRNRIENASSLRERYSAYCKALKDHDIPFDINLVITDYDAKFANKKDGKKKLDYLSNQLQNLFDLKVTAIFIENDPLIVSIFENFGQRGVSVPQNFCVTGFDRVFLPKWLNISYISVEQNFYEIGRKAAQVIINIIENREIEYKKVEIPVSYVEELVDTKDISSQ